ncbi:MAG: FHA domain-containing protein, partial [Euryarchaeota archaeon]|nr:FHA domain-containing protein [Euryarchaeota archaeon]
GALAYAIRLEILDKVRLPHALSEIRVAPLRRTSGSKAGTASRQAVKHHLDRLIEADLVRLDPDAGEDRPRYVVHPQRLYALTEELRSLSVNRVRYRTRKDVTETLRSGARTPRVEGPRLVLVHGVYEGQMYSLADEGGTKERWTIGRSEEADVRLTYDPFASMMNTYVLRHGDEHLVMDSGLSKNGTQLDWEPLQPNEAYPLRPGHVIGVGRSLLCFADD